ncbi:MAG: DUF6311 domain-containing protein [Devosia sp.]
MGDLAAIALGAAAFFIFCGWWLLIPNNIAWLTIADRTMHQLGWMFFRDTPWGTPPGVSPRLGIEVANSIALADSLPLFAIPFKLLGAWLPQPFQYWGYWFLLSFSLQSFFAYRLARELSVGRFMALMAAAFALITPAFLFRVPMHMALSGHFVLLAGLYLYARKTPPAVWVWPLLVALTAAIHGTLLAMVLGIWFAAWVQRLWLGRIRLVPAAAEIILIPSLVGIVLWAVGFLEATSFGTYGYGDYKLNLLWPLIRYRWSSIFPDLPHTRFDYEGLSFLGIGIIALLVIAIVTGAIASLRRLAGRFWLPLVLSLVVMMVFGYSKNISLGSIELVHLPVPEFINKIGAAFRSTGRFVWPILYLVTIGSVALVARRFRLAVALPLVLAAFIGQAVDSAPAWRAFAKSIPAPADIWPTPLRSPIWQRAADAGYNRVRAIPVTGLNRDYRWLGYYAVLHGMEVDAIYLARIDEDAYLLHRANTEKMLETGDFEPKTVYTLDVYSAFKAQQHLTPNDFLGMIDGRIVFIRGGARLAEGVPFRPFTQRD